MKNFLIINFLKIPQFSEIFSVNLGAGIFVTFSWCYLAITTLGAFTDFKKKRNSSHRTVYSEEKINLWARTLVLENNGSDWTITFRLTRYASLYVLYPHYPVVNSFRRECEIPPTANCHLNESKQQFHGLLEKSTGL